MRSVYIILAREAEESTKMYLKETGYEDVDWIYLVQNRVSDWLL
jgi:hypothetical protein